MTDRDSTEHEAERQASEDESEAPARPQVGIPPPPRPPKEPPRPVGPGRGRLQKVVLIALACLPLSALGTRFGVWDYRVGLGVFALGLLVTLVCGLIGLVALIRSRKSPQSSGPGPEISVFAAVVTIIALWPYVMAGFRSPPISQVSTDLENPPGFPTLLLIRGAAANPLLITQELAQAQREGYPWLQPQYVPIDPDLAFAGALSVLEEVMVLEIVNVDRVNRVIEATDTTLWFGFKDDVSVRVLPDGLGARIDIRSASRVGESDLGANADRVGEFLTRFAVEMSVEPQPAR